MAQKRPSRWAAPKALFILALAFIATAPIHELGHAMFLACSGATIMEIKWINTDILQPGTLSEQDKDRMFMLGYVIHDDSTVKLSEPLLQEAFIYGRKLSGGLLVFLFGAYAKLFGRTKTAAALICAGVGGMASDMLDTWVGSPDLLMISAVAIFACIIIMDRPLQTLFEND